MKGIKKLSLVALSFAFALGIASCASTGDTGTTNSGTTPTQTTSGDSGNTSTNTNTNTNPDDGGKEQEQEKGEQIIEYGEDGIPKNLQELEDIEAPIGELSKMEKPGNYPDVYINEDNKLSMELQSLTAYTNYARTRFYLGESFSDEGLIVVAIFRFLDEDGKPAKTADGYSIRKVARIRNYSIDISEVDTNVLGTYPVKVSYRYGGTVQTSSYSISVLSSEFETTKDLEYCAGIKIGYKEDQNSNIFKLTNDGRIATTYQQRNGKNNYTLDISQLKAQIVTKKVDSTGFNIETTFEDYDLLTFTNDTTNKKITSPDGKFSLDYSAVNTGIEGSYKIWIRYNAGKIQVNGKEIDNIVDAFIVVDVIRPVLEIEKEESEYTISASMDLPDFSEYYVVITRQYLNGKTLTTKTERKPITKELFNFKGIVSYNKGTQNPTFELKEKTEDGKVLSFENTVIINESTIYNIATVTDISTGEGVDYTDDSGEVVKGIKVDNNKTYYNNVVLNSVVSFHGGLEATNIADKSRDSEDGLSFKGFAKLKGSQYIEFNISKPATLILYVGSNGDDEREFVFYDENENVVDRQFTESGMAKQTPSRFVIEIKEAGTYKLMAAGSELTFHGYVLGIKK